MQAQRSFYEKAVSDGFTDGAAAKLAAQTASLYGSALSKLGSEGELVDLVGSEASIFRSADKTFMGNMQSSRAHALALSEWHSAKELEKSYEYGKQIARLALAVKRAKEAVGAAEAAALPAAEKKVRCPSSPAMLRLPLPHLPPSPFFTCLRYNLPPSLPTLHTPTCPRSRSSISLFPPPLG